MNNIKNLQKLLGAGADGIIGNDTLTKFQCHFGVPNKASVAHFFGNLHHESIGFTATIENLNYSAEALLKTFKKYFPTLKDAQAFARQPEKIANKVYGGRMGNNTTGDGWKYRGRWGIQLTGKDNYVAFQKWLRKKGYTGVDVDNVVNNPDAVGNKFFWEAAIFFFESRGLFNLVSDISDASIEKVRRVVNGGVNGLADTQNKVKYYFGLFK